MVEGRLSSGWLPRSAVAIGFCVIGGTLPPLFPLSAVLRGIGALWSGRGYSYLLFFPFAACKERGMPTADNYTAVTVIQVRISERKVTDPGRKKIFPI